MCFRPVGVSKPKRCVCGTLNPPNAEVCRKCGVELPKDEEQKLQCPRCAQMNPLDAEACEGCGLTPDEAAKYL